MARAKKWTDEQVEAEIARLNASDFVKLARKEQQIKNRRRQHMWMGNQSLPQWIFLTQESNRVLLHCRWILYRLSYEVSPKQNKSC